MPTLTARRWESWYSDTVLMPKISYYSWANLSARKRETDNGRGRDTKRRRRWQLAPVLLPGEAHGRRSVVGYSPRARKSRTRLSDFTFTSFIVSPSVQQSGGKWTKMGLRANLGLQENREWPEATDSSILAWRNPWTEETGRLKSIGCKESDTTETLTFLLFHRIK